MNRALRTLIVDDEPIARQVLREGLQLIPDIEIAGEAENGKQALLKIEKLQPDLVFLDLQMPVMGGFEVVRSLGNGPLPMLVIVTAYDEHAIQAFEASAINYLLKLVSDARLQKAVERARSLHEKPLEVANAVPRLLPPQLRSSPALRARSWGELEESITCWTRMR